MEFRMIYLRQRKTGYLCCFIGWVCMLLRILQLLCQERHTIIKEWVSISNYYATKLIIIMYRVCVYIHIYIYIYYNIYIYDYTHTHLLHVRYGVTSYNMPFAVDVIWLLLCNQVFCLCCQWYYLFMKYIYIYIYIYNSYIQQILRLINVY